MGECPHYLRHKSGAQLWIEYRRNDSNLWQSWPEDYDCLPPTLLEAAELLNHIEEIGGTVEINLDVTLPPGCEDDLDDGDRQLLKECGAMVKGLLRFSREADYNLRQEAER